MRCGFIPRSDLSEHGRRHGGGYPFGSYVVCHKLPEIGVGSSQVTRLAREWLQEFFSKACREMRQNAYHALTFATTKVRGVHILSASVDIDMTVQAEFRDALDKAVAAACLPLVVDLTGIHWIGSVGLGALVATHKTLNTASGKQLYIVVNDPRLRRTMSVLGLDKLFAIYLSTEDATTAAIQDLT